MNKGINLTADDMPITAGLFATVPTMYGADSGVVVIRNGLEAPWRIREGGRTRLPFLCGFVHSLQGGD